MKHKYTSIDRIFSKVIRDFRKDISEADVIEWCGEALEFTQAVRAYEEAVAFIEVKNHQCQLPAGIHAVIQVARNNSWAGPTADSFCPAKAVEEVPAEENTVPVAIDCNGQPLNDHELAYYRPYFDLKWEYELWGNSNLYQQYTPVRLSNNTFFNTIVCKEEDQQIYSSCTDEYTVVNGQMLRFSFKEGMVAVAYLRQVLDPETGYPMIPDNISYTTAIVKYITLKVMEKDFYAGREGSAQKVEKAERDWHWYCKQASNTDMMPQGIDEYQNLLDQRSYILPRQNRYYGFFGKMNKPENRIYNDPDRRNWHGYHFRGN
jgi:hypothetical protein